ncbi:MAG: hypothetical protein JW731_03985 [Bacteroidales bacterium]|nr:hypothetical protein [Bacteroidales bacterium]
MRFVAFVILLFIILIPASIAVAQDVGKTEEITVVAPYQPSVSEAFKINISPRIPDEKLEKPQFQYEIKSKVLKSEPDLEPIVPAQILGESVSKLYKNYIKAGIGNYATPYLEFFAHKLRSKKNAFGVRFKHHSSLGNIKDYAYPGNSDTRISAFGKKFMKYHTLSAEVYYDRKGVHYYGYKPDDFPGIDLSNKDLKQHYNLVGLSTLLESNYLKDQKVNHSVGLDYYYLADKQESQEHNIRFKAGLDKNFGFFSFSDSEKLGIDLSLDYYINADKVHSSAGSGIIGFEPYYNMIFEQYSFKVGVKTAIRSDTSNKVHVYPVAQVEVKVVQDHLITYAGIDGNLTKNSLKSFTDENPFIVSVLPQKFTNDKIDQYGGIKGSISQYLDYNLSFMNSTFDDMPFFVNDTASLLGEGLNNQFTVVYDKVKYTRVTAEFGFHMKDKFNAMVRGNYNNYFLDNEDKAWHKPALEISLLADYNIQDKFLVKGELITRSKMYAKSFTENANGGMDVVAEELDGFVDLSLGVEYRYSKILSGFIDLNNILGQRYFRWYNYPSYRFNVLVGVTYSF